jgi:hypothetical protein
MINTSASERTRQIRLLRGLATDSEKLGSYKSVYNPGLTIAALPKFFSKLDAGTQRANTTPPDPNPPPTISNLAILFLFGPSSNPTIPGHNHAYIIWNTPGATITSFVITLQAAPYTVVTGTPFSLRDGSNMAIYPPTSQTISAALGADASGGSCQITSVTTPSTFLGASASLNGPYTFTLTASNAFGSVTQSINVPIYTGASPGPTPPV